MTIFRFTTLWFCWTLPTFAFSSEQKGRVVELFLDKHKFNIEVIEMKPHEKIQIIVKNNDKNFEEFESKSLNIEKFLKPGATVKVYVGPLPIGEYDYFAEFHPATGKGKIVVRP